MQLGQRAAVLPRPPTDMDAAEGDVGPEWVTRDLTALLQGGGTCAFDSAEGQGGDGLNQPPFIYHHPSISPTAPPVAPGTAVCPFGPWADGRVIYAGWDGHLYELDTASGALQDLTARFKVRPCMRLGYSHTTIQPRVAFASSSSSHWTHHPINRRADDPV